MSDEKLDQELDEKGGEKSAEKKENPLSHLPRTVKGRKRDGTYIEIPAPARGIKTTVRGVGTVIDRKSSRSSFENSALFDGSNTPSDGSIAATAATSAAASAAEAVSSQASESVAESAAESGAGAASASLTDEDASGTVQPVTERRKRRAAAAQSADEQESPDAELNR